MITAVIILSIICLILIIAVWFLVWAIVCLNEYAIFFNLASSDSLNDNALALYRKTNDKYDFIHDGYMIYKEYKKGCLTRFHN